MADTDEDRGQPAGFDPKTGEVRGSGSGAGGGNPGEDYDRDSKGGSGAEPPHGPRPAGDAAVRPTDPDEGI